MTRLDEMPKSTLEFRRSSVEGPKVVVDPEVTPRLGFDPGATYRIWAEWRGIDSAVSGRVPAPYVRRPRPSRRLANVAIVDASISYV